MTITSYKGRMITDNTVVFAYRNLHKAQWSLKAMTGPHKGKVIGHADEVSLMGAEFKVSEAGRRRVLAEKKKNVHAGVVGLIALPPANAWDDQDFDPEAWYDGLPAGVGHRKLKVSYNPYRAGAFMVGDEPVRVADVVQLASDGKAYIYGTVN
ncbi:hypothetical protein KIW74_gp08 [Mycobacterium phage Kimona]|uniref:Uncharacterized protein n=1 Tax=Mycobacterium phage Kimona TaxID=2024295 RepID=A0A249XU57_9CAUD|nr:hypothetical protein KIW74_gp08 [Mycobacterium phage Kimona]ASZ75520.1 hypothetical protein PBI_KIMONA_84 [Mycobacterium phage Kimona]